MWQTCEKGPLFIFFLFSHFFHNLANPNFYFKSRNCFLAESTNRQKEKKNFFEAKNFIFKWVIFLYRNADQASSDDRPSVHSIEIYMSSSTSHGTMNRTIFSKPVQIMIQKDRPQLVDFPAVKLDEDQIKPESSDRKLADSKFWSGTEPKSEIKIGLTADLASKKLATA